MPIYWVEICKKKNELHQIPFLEDNITHLVHNPFEVIDSKSVSRVDIVLIGKILRISKTIRNLGLGNGDPDGADSIGSRPARDDPSCKSSAAPGSHWEGYVCQTLK